jgi:putative transposase
MSALIEARDPVVPLKSACAALGFARATLYRHRRAPVTRLAHAPRYSPRRLSEAQRREVLAVLHEERFIDQPPAEVYAKLLDEGRYLCSVRTMHRLLAEAGESGERRAVRPKTHHPVPRLEASAPNQVWTWDITKLATLSRGVFLNLYVVLDLYSRFVVAWMVAGRENSALAKQLLAEAIHRHGVEPGSLRVHQDRGAPMTARGFLDLLADLKVEPSHSRPRVSNDNAFSESQFKTLKYQPDFPGRFRDVEHGRAWCSEFFDWYNHHHQHAGLALFTPADVFCGRVEALLATRQAALDTAYAAHPERFVRGRPVAARPPKVVAINPMLPEQDLPAPAASLLPAEQANTLSQCEMAAMAT